MSSDENESLRIQREQQERERQKSLAVTQFAKGAGQGIDAGQSCLLMMLAPFMVFGAVFVWFALFHH